MELDIDVVYQRICDAVNGAELDGNTATVTALPYMPDAVTPPVFHLDEFVADYDKDYGGGWELTITARLLLSRATDSTGQQEAQRLAGTGTNTMRAAISAAAGAPGQEALDGAADDIQVKRARGPRLYDYGDNAHFYGLEFTIFVLG